MLTMRNVKHQKCELMLTHDNKQNTRNEYFLGQHFAKWYLGKYVRPRESSRVSERASGRMVDSSVGARGPSNEYDWHTHPTCHRIGG